MNRSFGELPSISRGDIIMKTAIAEDSTMEHRKNSPQSSVEELDEMIERSKLYEHSLRRLKDVVEAQEAYRRSVEAAKAPRVKRQNELSAQMPNFPRYDPNSAGLAEPEFNWHGQIDVEKAESATQSNTNETGSAGEVPTEGRRAFTLVRHLCRSFIVRNFEERGIERVEPHERHDLRTFGFVQVALVWFSMNLAANNITLGMLGPATFGLGFLDACMCAIFGMLLGNLPVAYIAMFGPRSGHRTLIFSRYIMGWHPSKLVVLLNIIVNLGYAMIDCVIAGQMLSAVSTGGELSIVVGIVIVAIISLVVSTFGYQVFHHYERYAWVPQLIVLCILAGVARPDFNISSTSQGSSATRVGNRLSFFSLCFSAAVTYAGSSSTFFVYYPETIAKWKVFLPTMVGLSLSFVFTFVLGIGLASGMATKPSWQEAYHVSQGAVIIAGFAPLGAFGSFCGVVVALGLIANIVPPAYASGVDFQILGRHAAKAPRVVWNLVGIITFAVCAIAGRENLAEIFTNFLALMGYWCTIWIAITLEEHYIFRKSKKATTESTHSPAQLTDEGFDWTLWNKRESLPLGIAASVAFMIGWVGAILCMAQVWYIGPIASLVGDYGGDMGNYVGFAWAALVFPPLRWWELKKFGR